MSVKEVKRVRLKSIVRSYLVIATETETFGDLAERTGVSRNWISKVFNQKVSNCRIEYAQKLADTLGTPLEVISEPIEDTADFGIMLNRLRRVQGLSQTQLADAMGIHPSKLSRIEKGAFRAHLTFEQIELAVKALELSQSDADALVDAWAPLDLE
jgi:transcriptional regulator with XRE-family HTH domain